MATINGDSRNNNLLGTSANDVLNGFGGNDTLNGAAGIDTLIGGTGHDIYIVDSTTDTIIEYNNGGIDTVRSSVSYTLGAWLNNLTLTGRQAIDATGNNLNNILTGNNADNILDGRGGIDILVGGKGNDTYIVDTTTDKIIEYEGGGFRDTVKSSVSYTLGDWLNDLVLTGDRSINGTGNHLDNTITGNILDNILSGRGGNDVLIADTGFNEAPDDYGREGRDLLLGGAGNDTLLADDVDTLYGGAGDDSLRGGEVEYLSSGASYLYGGDGNDYLHGIIAVLYGDSGNDTIDAVYESTAYGGEGNDVMSAVEVSVAYGNAGNDTMYINWGGIAYAGSGNDTLTAVEGSAYGEDGDDVLYGSGNGGSGNDTLIGGSGYDYYVFDHPNQGIDTLVGFAEYVDAIGVSATGFGGGLVAGGAIAPEQLHYGTVATNVNQRFIYNLTNGALFFDVDGTGSSPQKQLAQLFGAPLISSNNILVTV